VNYVARALQVAGGFEQCVFSTGPEDRLFEYDGTPVRVLRNEAPYPRPMDVFSAALWQELPGFDLVHIHQCLSLFSAYSIAIVRSLGIPAVGTDLGGGENALMVQGRGIELLDGMLSISKYARSLTGNFFSGTHEVLIGPVDTQRFSPTPGAVRDRRAVLCVSRIMPHKGIDRIIAALPPELRLVIVGRVYHEDYYGLLRQMAQGKDVEFILDAEDEKLLELYRSSAVFVQASTAKDIYGNFVSKSELMGLTTLEAMACGLPVVVSDTGSLPELVTDPRFARVFSNTDELAAILRSVASEEWPQADAGELARTHVVMEHGMEPIGRRLGAFYRAVLAARSGR
jgi:glycosyltransferase involved in cell wall biosynthesis